MQLQVYFKEIRRLLIFIVPVFFVIYSTYLLYNITDQETAFELGKEDGFYEWGTFVAYFASFVFLILTFRRTRNIFILLLAMVMFFGAFEEISWGQRLIGYNTPDSILQYNVQGEFTIHNLELFNPLSKKGEEKEGLAQLTNLNFLLKIFNLLFGIALPFFVFHFKVFSDLSQKFRVPVPPVSIGIFFLFSWIGIKYVISCLPQEFIHLYEIQYAVEIAEFNSAFIMAMISLYFYKYLNGDSIGKDIKQTAIIWKG